MSTNRKDLIWTVLFARDYSNLLIFALNLFLHAFTWFFWLLCAFTCVYLRYLLFLVEAAEQGRATKSKKEQGRARKSKKNQVKACKAIWLFTFQFNHLKWLTNNSANWLNIWHLVTLCCAYHCSFAYMYDCRAWLYMCNKKKSHLTIIKTACV